MIHQMKLQATPFDLILEGSKKIEIRLNDEKRQQVQIGDEIVFTNVAHTASKLKMRVLGLHHFGSFKALFESFAPEAYGSISTDEYTKMYTFYSEEDEKKYGVLGIEIEKI